MGDLMDVIKKSDQGDRYADESLKEFTAQMAQNPQFLELIKIIHEGKAVKSAYDQEQERAREVFLKKAEILRSSFGDPVTPLEFYRDVFPVGSFERRGICDDEKPNGIAMVIKSGKKNYSKLIFDDLQELETLSREYDFVITSPIAYIGKRRNAENARLIFGIAIDLDGVEENHTRDLLFQMQNKILPTPTYIINSGHGFHLYYLFENPVKAYPRTMQKLHSLKYGLIERIWNRYTSSIKERQKQGNFQGFRVVGSPSKLGREYPVTAYHTGRKVTVEYLNDFVDANHRLNEYSEKGEYTLSEAREQFPEWYQRRIIDGLPPKTWKVNRAVYENWKKRIYLEAVAGHRYFCILTLAVYARKCGVEFSELETDAEELREQFDKLSETDPFTVDDVKSALKAYEVESYVRMKKETISNLTSIQIKTNRRNGRTQEEHLRRIRRDQKDDDPSGEWRNKNGRPPESGSAAQTVRSWRMQNQRGRKADCARDTGLHRNTVSKWWNTDNQN